MEEWLASHALYILQNSLLNNKSLTYQALKFRTKTFSWLNVSSLKIIMTHSRLSGIHLVFFDWVTFDFWVNFWSFTKISQISELFTHFTVWRSEFHSESHLFQFWLNAMFVFQITQPFFLSPILKKNENTL